MRARFGWKWFIGDYPSWAAARSACSGYDDAGILVRILAATKAVRAGQSAYDRDGVLFPVSKSENGLIAALRTVAGARGGRLRVLDFGGSLGTTYWRHRAELANLRELSWDIVEQRSFVTVGRANFDDTLLRFFETVDAAVIHPNSSRDIESLGSVTIGEHDVTIVALQRLGRSMQDTITR